jgi:hypothetical protein
MVALFWTTLLALRLFLALFSRVAGWCILLLLDFYFWFLGSFQFLRNLPLRYWWKFGLLIYFILDAFEIWGRKYSLQFWLKITFVCFRIWIRSWHLFPILVWQLEKISYFLCNFIQTFLTQRIIIIVALQSLDDAFSHISELIRPNFINLIFVFGSISWYFYSDYIEMFDNRRNSSSGSCFLLFRKPKCTEGEVKLPIQLTEHIRKNPRFSFIFFTTVWKNVILLAVAM